MKITDKKIIEALERGDYITSNNFPKYVFLRQEGEELQLKDWGQNMDCHDFLYNNFIKLLKENTFYISDEKGNKI